MRITGEHFPGWNKKASTGDSRQKEIHRVYSRTWQADASEGWVTAHQQALTRREQRRSGGTADAAVSKTAGGNPVRVRVPPSAPSVRTIRFVDQLLPPPTSDRQPIVSRNATGGARWGSVSGRMAPSMSTCGLEGSDWRQLPEPGKKPKPNSTSSNGNSVSSTVRQRSPLPSPSSSPAPSNPHPPGVPGALGPVLPAPGQPAAPLPLPDRHPPPSPQRELGKRRHMGVRRGSGEGHSVNDKPPPATRPASSHGTHAE